MIQKTGWILFALLCIGIGFYPAIYFIIDEKFGLLGSKPEGLLGSAAWRSAFYVHIALGGVALLSGWSQFSEKIRTARPGVHRSLGKIYVVSVLLSATAGIYIAFFATGGIIPAAGFGLLGLVWFFTTAFAYKTIREGNIDLHRNLMVYSYAACFAAVTLRIWLPLLIMLFGSFSIAYPIVAWLCWVPNLVVARVIVVKNNKMITNPQ
ncbi:DUF2306 domain-containing protein [Sediminibacterium soli]|uniref:DUF2306 domain-containing protein n=1 Tax=Sediminibacterium soli TaxID=2698829 RepID=UPI00137A6F63|nr:DUF2306 domain-containing protein [Sediminibacterium soli]NCI47861.1 DUF2306 domain-containing protein [Sediminibacterium soli]